MLVNSFGCRFLRPHLRYNFTVMKNVFLIILKVLLIALTLAAIVIIILHTQTIPFILLVILSLVGYIIYKKQKNKLSQVTQQKDIALVQLQAVSSATNSGTLYTALADIQTQIIKNEVSNRVNNAPDRIALPLFNETRYVNFSDIIRCEADNAYTIFKLKDSEEILVSRTLKEYADLLAGHGFIRTHQSHLINLSFVKSWLREDGGCLLLYDGTKIPVSKLNKDAVKTKLSGIA